MFTNWELESPDQILSGEAKLKNCLQDITGMTDRAVLVEQMSLDVVEMWGQSTTLILSFGHSIARHR